MLRIHAYGLQVAPEEVAARSLEADCADLPFFREFVAAVRARGDGVAVASFGRFEVIHAYMERICPGLFARSNISTPSCVGVADGCAVPGGKTPQLDRLLSTLLAAEGSDASALEEHRARVLFLDDSERNVLVRCGAVRLLPSFCTDARRGQLARAAGYARSYVVPPGGFTRAVWDGIVRDGSEPAVL